MLTHSMPLAEHRITGAERPSIRATSRIPYFPALMNSRIWSDNCVSAVPMA